MENTHAPAAPQQNRQSAPHRPDKAITALGAAVVGVGLGFGIWGAIIGGVSGLIVGNMAEKNYTKSNRQ